MCHELPEQQTTKCLDREAHVIDPLLYAIFSHNCSPIHPTNTIVKFADDTTRVGLISNNYKTANREDVQHLANWCYLNNLVLNKPRNP